MREIDDCQRQLNELLDVNEHAPEIEKLERAEFLIDEEYRDILVKKGLEEVKKAREEIHFNNLAKKYLADNIKRQCWDSMEVHYCVVESLRNGEEVCNYPLPFISAEETNHLEKIKALRRVELLNFSAMRVRHIVVLLVFSYLLLSLDIY